MRQPNGNPIRISRNTSPSRMYDTSPTLKPSTRSVANSRPCSESAMRPLLYTTPNASVPAKPTKNEMKIITVSAIVS